MSYRKHWCILSLAAALLSLFPKRHAQNGSNTIYSDLSSDSTTVSILFYTGLNGYHAFRFPTVIKIKKVFIAFVEDGFSAYSALVRLDKKALGVIYETDDYKRIRFRRIPFNP